jgi:hypothetical protein
VHAVTHAQRESLGLRTFALLCCFHADLRDSPSRRRRHEGKNFRNMDEVEEGLIIGDPATKWVSYTVTVKIVIVLTPAEKQQRLPRSPSYFAHLGFTVTSMIEGRDKHFDQD